MAQIDYVRAVNVDGIEESVPVKKYEAMKDQYALVDFPGADAGNNPYPAFGPADIPAKNASAEDWREFTRQHAGARGLSSEQVEQMGRDDMAATFNAAPPATAAASGTASTTEES